eukprot:15886774-Heterocapsa_arctica.AAC.1
MSLNGWEVVHGIAAPAYVLSAAPPRSAPSAAAWSPDAWCSLIWGPRLSSAALHPGFHVEQLL